MIYLFLRVLRELRGERFFARIVHIRAKGRGTVLVWHNRLGCDL
jgi:hypothetical protein